MSISLLNLLTLLYNFGHVQQKSTSIWTATSYFLTAENMFYVAAALIFAALVREIAGVIL